VGSDSIDRLDPEHNRKVRRVVQLLEQHSNIKRAGDRPIKLLWIDDDNTPKPDEDIPPTDIHPTDDTPSIDSQPTNPKPSDISDVTDTTKSTKPIEDYEAYVDRQKRVFDAIELETQAQETPNGAQHVAGDRTEPLTREKDPIEGKTADQKSTFWRIFDELEREDAVRRSNPEEAEVLGTKFREALVSSGKFSQVSSGDIAIIIEELGDGLIEQIYTELDGVICDIYRRKNNN
jgi:hypothetical protein